MKCLINDCKRDANCRGLCWPCYQMALRYIKAGKTTWSELISKGLAKDTNYMGRDNSPFTKLMKEQLPQPDPLIINTNEMPVDVKGCPVIDYKEQEQEPDYSYLNTRDPGIKPLAVESEVQDIPDHEFNGDIPIRQKAPWEK